MTGPRDDPRGAGSPLVVAVAPDTRAVPGGTVGVAVRVTSGAAAPLDVVVTLVGLPVDWTVVEARVEGLHPGQFVDLMLAVTATSHSEGGELPALVVATPTLAGSDTPAGPPGDAPTALVVGAGGDVRLSLGARELRGRHHRVVVRLANRTLVPQRLTLDLELARGLRGRLPAGEVTVPGGTEVAVTGRVRARRPVAGQAQRFPFLITGLGQRTPVRSDGVYVATPYLSRGVVKSLAFVLVIALWASVAFATVTRLADRAGKRDAGSTSAPAVTPSAGANGDGNPGAGGAGGAGGVGSPGSGGAGGQLARPGGSTVTDAGTAGGVRINGTVTSTAPAGVTVSLAPTSLVDEAAQGAESISPTGVVLAPAAFRRGTGARGVAAGADVPTAFGSGPVGKLSPSALLPELTPAGPVSSARSTATNDTGGFAFAGIRAPGYYLLTLAKPGFQSRRFVLAPQPGDKPLTLDLSLTAGRGLVSGTVVDPEGAPRGGASVTVTDGTTTVSATTPTAGRGVGTWTTAGLSTPGTYTVTASLPGYGSASSVVALAPGQTSAGPVRLVVDRDSALLRGRVLDGAAGLGGATVSVSDGTTTRTTTTLTAAPAGGPSAALAGTFTLPSVPVGPTYTISVTAPGFLPVARRVPVPRPDSPALAPIAMTRSTATVRGVVLDADGHPVIGAGVTLTGPGGTYKTTTRADDPPGGFTIEGVVPGDYVVTITKFGLPTRQGSVTATAGGTSTVDLGFATSPTTGGLLRTSSIAGALADGVTRLPLDCGPDVLAKDCAYTVATTDTADDGSALTFTDTQPPANDYLLPRDPTQGLAPGQHRVTARAPGYADGAVDVRGPLGRPSRADITLAPLGTITGTITSSVDSVPAATCVVVVPLTGSERPAAPACVPATTPTGRAGCTTVAPARCSFVDPDGAYEVRDLDRGTYLVSVTVPGGDYVPVAPLRTTLALSENRRYDVRLDRYGHLTVQVQTPADDDTLGPAGAGVTVTLTGPAGATIPAPRSTDDGSAVTFTGLAAGVWTATATRAPPGQAAQKGASLPVTVLLNTDNTTALVIAAPVGDVFGRVNVLVDGQAHPVPCAKVTLRGTVGYAGSTPVSSGDVGVTTDVNGFFHIVPAQSTGVVDAACAGAAPRVSAFVVQPATIPGAPGSPAGGTAPPPVTLPLVSRSLTVSVAGPSPDLPGITGRRFVVPAGTAQIAVTLATPSTAVAVSVVEPRDGNDGATPPSLGTVPVPAPASVSVAVVDRTGSQGTVSVAYNGGGFVWSDTAATGPSGLATPGTYTLRVSAPRHDDALVQVVVPLADDLSWQSMVPIVLRLRPQGTIVLSGGTYALEPGSIARLTDDRTSTTTTATLDNQGSNVAFRDLPVTTGAAASPVLTRDAQGHVTANAVSSEFSTDWISYSLEVRGPGRAFDCRYTAQRAAQLAAQGSSVCTLPGKTVVTTRPDDAGAYAASLDPANPYDLQLRRPTTQLFPLQEPLGTVAGTVVATSGITGDTSTTPRSGVLVTATPLDGSRPTTAVTDSNGAYTLRGTTADGGEALLPGGYAVGVAASDGYAATSTRISISATNPGDRFRTVTLTTPPAPISLSVALVDDGGRPIPNGAVTFTGPNLPAAGLTLATGTDGVACLQRSTQLADVGGACTVLTPGSAGYASALIPGNYTVTGAGTPFVTTSTPVSVPRGSGAVSVPLTLARKQGQLSLAVRFTTGPGVALPPTFGVTATVRPCSACRTDGSAPAAGTGPVVATVSLTASTSAQLLVDEGTYIIAYAADDAPDDFRDGTPVRSQVVTVTAAASGTSFGLLVQRTTDVSVLARSSRDGAVAGELAGATLTLVAAGGAGASPLQPSTTLTATADGAGAGTFFGLPAGRYTATSSGPGSHRSGGPTTIVVAFTGSVATVTPPTPVVTVFERLLTIDVRGQADTINSTVTLTPQASAGGTPPPAETVTVLGASAAGGSHQASAYLDSRFAYSAQINPPPGYSVVGSASASVAVGTAPATAAFQLLANSGLDVRTTRSGQPLGGATVTVSSGSGSGAVTLTKTTDAATGIANFNVPSGTYSVGAVGPGGDAGAAATAEVTNTGSAVTILVPGPPPPPSSVIVGTPTPTTLPLSWTAPDPGTFTPATTGYRVVLTSGDTPPVIVTSSSTGTSTTVTGLTAGTTYSIAVSTQSSYRAGGSTGDSATAAQASGTTVGRPAAVGALTAAPLGASAVDAGKIRVTWSAPATDPTHGAATSYTVAYRRTTDADFTRAPDQPQTALSTTLAVAGGIGGDYVVQVTATNGAGDGPPTVTDPVTIRDAVPGAPGDVAFVATTTPGQLALSWTAAPGVVTGYQVQYRLTATPRPAWTNAPAAVAPGTAAAPYTVDGLAAGSYEAQVLATNSTGSGPYAAAAGTATVAP